MRQALRTGQPVPEHILNAPELQLGLQLYFQAFLDLDGERLSPTSPIPWTSIRSYAEAYQLDQSQTSDLFYLIKRIDSAHLKRMHEKTKPT